MELRQKTWKKWSNWPPNHQRATASAEALKVLVIGEELPQRSILRICLIRTELWLLSLIIISDGFCRSKLLPPPPGSNCGAIPRSASSSQMVSNSKAAGETLGLKSPSHQSFLSTNSHSNKHVGPRAKSLMHSRSKSIANVTHVRSHSNLIHKSTNNANNPPSSPRVSHHQPCPNHVAGKTFAEMGTQTLPKPNRKRSQSLEEIGCVASLKKRYRDIHTTHVKWVTFWHALYFQTPFEPIRSIMHWKRHRRPWQNEHRFNSSQTYFLFPVPSQKMAPPGMLFS